MVAIIVAYTGDAEEGERVLQPLRDLGPAMDMVAPIPYLAVQKLIEPGNQPGHRHYWKADLLDDLPDDAIDTIAEFGLRMTSPLTVMLFQPLGGAVARVPASATALGRRDAAWAYHALSQWDLPEDDEKNIGWTRELADAMQPYSTGGVYITYTSDDGDDRMRDAFRDHYDRLVAIKDRYDPGNLFHLGQNIRPSVEAAARADRP
jgi:FAD/FMN-containing dehydrogenase